MSFHIRSHISLYYRLLFVTLFLLLGASSLAVVFLENYTEINIITAESDIEQGAIHSILTIMGILGICTSGIMVYLMQEKRSPNTDRRKTSQPTSFNDRRGNVDRRSARFQG